MERGTGGGGRVEAPGGERLPPDRRLPKVMAGKEGALPCPVLQRAAESAPRHRACRLARTHHAAAEGPGSPGRSMRRGSARSCGCCNPLRSALL